VARYPAPALASAHQPRRLRTVARAAALCAALAGAGAAQAQTLYWDANGGLAGTGGTGTWNASTANWADTALGIGLPPIGSVPRFWPGANASAVFAGTAGTVTLVGALAANDLKFQTSGYTLAGSGSVTVSGLVQSLGSTTLAAQLVSAGATSLQGSFNLARDAVLAGSFNALAGTLLVVQNDSALRRALVNLAPGASIDWGTRTDLYIGGLGMAGQTLALGDRRMFIEGVAGQTSVLENTAITGSRRAWMFLSGGTTLVHGSGGFRPSATMGVLVASESSGLTLSGVDLNLPVAAGVADLGVPTTSLAVQGTATMSFRDGTRAVAAGFTLVADSATLNVVSGSTLRLVADAQSGVAGTLAVGMGSSTGATVNADGSGSRLDAADAIYLGIQPGFAPGVGRLVLSNGAAASTPLLAITGAGSALTIGAGSQLTTGRFLQVAGGNSSGSTVQIDGSFVYGDATLVSTRITTGLFDNFDGVLAGSSTGVLRKVGDGSLTLSNPASTFAGVVQLEAGTLNTSITALKNARLSGAATATLAFTDVNAASTIAFGALDGRMDLNLAGASLLLGGGNQSGNWSGRLTGGSTASRITKVGTGSQTWDLRGQTPLAPMGNLSINAGSFVQRGGTSTFTASGSTGFAGTPSSVFLEGPAELRLTDGAVVNAWATPQLHNNASLVVAGGSQFNVLRTPSGGTASMRVGYAGGVSQMQVQEAGSRLTSQDLIELGGTFAANPGRGQLSVNRGASATAPVLRLVGAESALVVGSGGTVSINRLTGVGGAPALGALVVNGTLNTGDETLVSPLVFQTGFSSFAGTLSGSGTVNKLGSSYLELLSPGGIFTGAVNATGGTLATKTDTLSTALLSLSGGAQWLVDGLSSRGTVQLGGLWGSSDIGFGVATLVFGGGGQFGSYTGRFTTGQVALVKTGPSFQEFVRTGLGETFTAPTLSARGGTTNLIGGRFAFTNVNAADPLNASLNASGAGTQLRLLGGAAVTAQTDVRILDGGSLSLDAGSSLDVQRDFSGRSAVFVGAGSASSGQLLLTNGSALTANNVVLFSPPAASSGSPATMAVQSASRATVAAYVQFETDNARLVVDGGWVIAQAGWFVRNPATFAGSIALSDAADGTAALPLGPNWGQGQLMPAFNGRITDASSGPGSIRKQGAGTLPLAQPLEITGRLVIDGGKVQPSSTDDLKTVNVVLNSADGIDFSRLSLTSNATFLATFGALSGSADLTLPDSTAYSLGLGLTGLSGRYEGRLSTNMFVVKDGAGTQTLAGGGQAAGLQTQGGRLVIDGGNWQLRQLGGLSPIYTVGVDDNAQLEIRGGAVVGLTETGIAGRFTVFGTGADRAGTLLITDAGTRASGSEIGVFRSGTLRVASGASLVAEGALWMQDATSLLAIDQGFVRTRLSSDGTGRVTVSDAAQATTTPVAALRTGLTLVAPTPPPGSLASYTLNRSISDGTAGAGGVTFTGTSFFVAMTAAQTYTGPTVIEGAFASVSVPNGSASTTFVARQGGSVVLQPDSQGRFDATGKTLRTDATGSFSYPAQLTGGTLLGPAHAAINTRFNASTVGVGGVLTVPNNGSASGSLVLAGGTLVNNGSVSAALNVNDGGRVQGAGSFGAITLNAGGSFAPGNSAAKVNTGAVTLNAGARYEFEVANASGVAGTGFDQWFVTGGTTFAATAASPFTVMLQSVGAGGLAANFDPTRAYRWAVLSTDTLGGFAGIGLALDSSAWSNATAGGSFSLAWADNAGRSELNVIFAPVPEPGTWALMLGGVAALLAWRRRSARAGVS
jgi:fibronectin-binding autotransporter adhesin